MQLAGKTALVTGANSGLGQAVATALAARGARVLMLCRSAERGAAARDAIGAATGGAQLELVVCDLASQAAIRRAAAAVHQRIDALDLLVNNAGTAFAERGLTADGVERTLAVNHLGPFLLTHLLLDLLQAAARTGDGARIVNVGTKIDTAMDFSDLNWARRPYRMMAAYGEAKLGNIHFTRELARRLAGTGVGVNCVFPGGGCELRVPGGVPVQSGQHRRRPTLGAEAVRQGLRLGLTQARARRRARAVPADVRRGGRRQRAVFRCPQAHRGAAAGRRPGGERRALASEQPAGGAEPARGRWLSPRRHIS